MNHIIDELLFLWVNLRDDLERLKERIVVRREAIRYGRIIRRHVRQNINLFLDDIVVMQISVSEESVIIKLGQRHWAPAHGTWGDQWRAIDNECLDAEILEPLGSKAMLDMLTKKCRRLVRFHGHNGQVYFEVMRENG